jgi:transcriptional regulator with XRE-family HTH domain
MDKMLVALAGAARGARTERGATQLKIALRAGVSQETISRFERCEGWPHAVDRIISAYEAELGLPKRALWREAVGT